MKKKVRFRVENAETARIRGYDLGFKEGHRVAMSWCRDFILDALRDHHGRLPWETDDD